MNRKNNAAAVWVVVIALCISVVIMCASVIDAISRPRETGDLQPVIMYVGEENPGSADKPAPPAAYIKPDETTEIPDYVVLRENTEMRAVWVGYMSQYRLNEEKIDKIVADCKALGANAIIFHVRPFGDAMYKSMYFPWSHILTETQGQAPANDFDPLEYAIECAHANGMQLHAWVNPFRIQMTGGNLPDNLSADNPYNVFRTDSDPSNDLWVIDYNEGKFYNPGEEGARRLIVDGMAEIAANYNVDGLHWDDYFYPANDETFDDSVSYQNYINGGGNLSLIDWRTQNVNTIVRETYQKIKATNSNCVFGISPAGNINNCLLMGADVYEWGANSGYVDYICPQVYWTFSSEVAPFARRCEAWREIVSADGIKLYIGLALYKSGTDADNGQWIDNSDEIAEQIDYIRANGIEADGFAIFSYADFSREEAVPAVADIKEELLS